MDSTRDRGRTRQRGLGIFDPRKPLGPDDLLPDDDGQAVPRIARFLADDGSPRIGIVLESTGGVPRRLLDLTARHGLGPGFLEMVRAGGVAIAEQELAGSTERPTGSEVVTLTDDDLPRRLLSPVDIDAGQLVGGTRLVVGFGLTYRSHQEETSLPRPIVFPKPALPTGAYNPVEIGTSVGRRTTDKLLDYELELGCVPLRDIDLDRLEEVDAAADFAYFVVNDVSARGALLSDRRRGYARAKGQRTFMPTGPWLVPGAHFMRSEPALRRMVLTVTEADPYTGEGDERTAQTLRQNARLEDLTMEIGGLIELISRNRRLTMRGPRGKRWPVSRKRDGQWIIPAGSILLTGTPGGTAIRAPGRADKMALVLRSIRHLRWPSESYRRHLEAHHREFGFLSAGDRVSGWITGLGRQDWEVRDPRADDVVRPETP